MTDKTQSQQAVYGSSDVADLLKVQESTLRKYCLLLQDHNYSFLKNENGYRVFFDDDIIVLRKFLSLKNESDMTLNDAAKSVVAWKNGNDVSGVVTEDMRYISRYNDLVDEFKKFQKDQEDFNRQLLSQLEKQNDYINKRLEQRDQVLMLTLRETLDAKKEIAAVEEKKKKWWKFWQ